MENRFLKICEIQNRLQMLAPRPSRVLYKAEQYFWKVGIGPIPIPILLVLVMATRINWQDNLLQAQRLAYGNKGYIHCEVLRQKHQKPYIPLRKNNWTSKNLNASLFFNVCFLRETAVSAFDLIKVLEYKMTTNCFCNTELWNLLSFKICG